MSVPVITGFEGATGTTNTPLTVPAPDDKFLILFVMTDVGTPRFYDENMIEADYSALGISQFSFAGVRMFCGLYQEAVTTELNIDVDSGVGTAMNVALLGLDRADEASIAYDFDAAVDSPPHFHPTLDWLTPNNLVLRGGWWTDSASDPLPPPTIYREGALAFMKDEVYSTVYAGSAPEQDWAVMGFTEYSGAWSLGFTVRVSDYGGAGTPPVAPLPPTANTGNPSPMAAGTMPIIR